MKRQVYAAAVALGLLAANAAHAGITFQYVTDQESYSGASGSPVQVSVFLKETDTGGSQSILNAQGGLFSYGVYITQSAGATSGQSTIASFTSAAPFTQFTSGPATTSQSGLPANSIDYTNANNTSTPNGSVVANGYQVLVGTLNVVAGTTTTFTLTSMNSSNPTFNDPGGSGTAGSDNTFTLPTSNAKDLDTTTGSFTGANDGLSTFTVAAVAVPEPSSMLLCGLALGGMGFGAWRRRKGQVAVEPTACA